MKNGVPSYVYILITIAIAIGFLGFVVAQTQGKLKGREEDLANIAADMGLDKDQFIEDFKSEEIRDRAAESNDYAQERNISSTPTIFIDGEVPADRSVEALSTLIETALEDKEEGEVVLVEEFFDFQCGACASFHITMLQLEADYGDNEQVEFNYVPMLLGIFNEEISQAYNQALYAVEKQDPDLYNRMQAEIYKYQHGADYQYDLAVGILESEN